MPGYLVDEGGERTHAVVPVEEYERLKKSAENLETVRGYADEIMAVINRENPPEDSTEDSTPNPVAQDGSDHDFAVQSHENEDNVESGEPARGYGW